MILLLHISVALASLLTAGLTFVSPSRSRIRVSQGLVAATIVSGTYLVISMNVNLLHVCLMGVVYLAVIGFGLVVASRKLDTIKSLAQD